MEDLRRVMLGIKQANTVRLLRDSYGKYVITYNKQGYKNGVPTVAIRIKEYKHDQIQNLIMRTQRLLIKGAIK